MKKLSAKTNRSQLVATDQQFTLSLTQEGPNHVFGTSNYWLDVFIPESENENRNIVGARILMLDSRGGSLEEKIDLTQIDYTQKHSLHYIS